MAGFVSGDMTGPVPGVVVTDYLQVEGFLLTAWVALVGLSWG